MKWTETKNFSLCWIFKTSFITSFFLIMFILSGVVWHETEMCVIFTLISYSILLVPVESLADDPLRKHKWKRNITGAYQKQWVKYQEALIFKFVSSTSQNKSLVLHMKYFLNQLTKIPSIPYKKVTPIIENDLQCTVAPEGSSCISPKFTTHLNFWINIILGENLENYIVIRRSFVWLKLENTLRPFVEIPLLVIFGLAEICEYNLQIKHMDTPPAFHLHFCGIYSRLKVYPPNSKIEYMTTFGITSRESFIMHATFDILSANIIETTLFKPVSNIRFHYIFINIMNQHIINFYVIVNKLLQVAFYSLKEDKLFNHILFDGPGFFSPKIRSTFPFRCSTFQCILQVDYKIWKAINNLFWKTSQKRVAIWTCAQHEEIWQQSKEL